MKTYYFYKSNVLNDKTKKQETFNMTALINLGPQLPHLQNKRIKETTKLLKF